MSVHDEQQRDSDATRVFPVIGAASGPPTPAPPPVPPRPDMPPAAGAGAPFAITADGGYAARLAGTGAARYAERWTLDGPEPYAVPLPLDQPEEPDSEVRPLSDGRVLIHRRIGRRHAFSLLYPVGPRTGQLPLGVIEPPAGATIRLLPPAPTGVDAYALVTGATLSTVWRVAGHEGRMPERIADVEGRCTGGVWLDREGRLLAVDRQAAHDNPRGRVKAVAVDLGRGGEVTPLLQIGEDSDDRLLLADPDSGLLLVRSDASGEDRLGWGVLGSARPVVRFPECLRGEAGRSVPFAVQPGQALTPETCAVAFRRTDPAGYGPTEGLLLWRPADRHVFRLGAPVGWLGGAGLWTEGGRLRLPCSTPQAPCALVGLSMPPSAPAGPTRAHPSPPTASPASPAPTGSGPVGAGPVGAGAVLGGGPVGAGAVLGGGPVGAGAVLGGGPVGADPMGPGPVGAGPRGSGPGPMGGGPVLGGSVAGVGSVVSTPVPVPAPAPAGPTAEPVGAAGSPGTEGAWVTAGRSGPVGMPGAVLSLGQALAGRPTGF
ncbi:hypothetical protein ACN20G_18970 [Streptomyces sp. BI20]|uniref:hypothetical protein n=1 Tax=Streptomyces sp. BI20 TaxID=3403460 RepID=UPI003C7304C1